MITNDFELEKALERVSAFLERPPPIGSPEDQQFVTVLDEIAAYQPTITTPAAETALSAIRSRATELVRHAERLQKASAPRAGPEWSGYPADGGIGPTTGGT